VVLKLSAKDAVRTIARTAWSASGTGTPPSSQLYSGCPPKPLETSTTRPTCPLPSSNGTSARAENRRFWLLSALCAHTKAPYKTESP
jgi:hypothetical protein